MKTKYLGELWQCPTCGHLTTKASKIIEGERYHSEYIRCKPLVRVRIVHALDSRFRTPSESH